MRHIHSSGSLESSVLAAVFATVVKALRAYADGIGCARRLHREYVALNAMSDVALRAIGLARSDIPAVVTHTYRVRAADSQDRPRKPSRIFR